MRQEISNKEKVICKFPLLLNNGKTDSKTEFKSEKNSIFYLKSSSVVNAIFSFPFQWSVLLLSKAKIRKSRPHYFQSKSPDTTWILSTFFIYTRSFKFALKFLLKSILLKGTIFIYFLPSLTVFTECAVMSKKNDERLFTLGIRQRFSTTSQCAMDNSYVV